MSDSGSVFAPKGLQQAEQRAAAEAQGRRSFLPRASGEGAPSDSPFAPRQWYTGANQQGMKNGYDTPFFQKFFAQQEEASKQNKLAELFDREDATGIVTYDHTSRRDPGRRYEFGDVYDNGKLVGNVYRTYDRQTADLMMADLTLDDDTKARAFKNGGGAISDEVTRRRRTTESDVEKWLTQSAYRADVDRQRDEFEANGGEELTVLGGAAGGAATGAAAGAAVGALFGGVGAAPGAAIGGLIGGLAGGVGAYFNQDELLDQAARAEVQADMAHREFGAAAGASQRLQGWSGLAMKAMTPLGNVVHGVYDEAQGTVGDRQSEFYRVDEKGGLARSGWMTAADLTAGIADSIVQFASPLARVMYMGSMTANIGGQIGTLAATGGSTFDDRRGAFDDIFTDEDGKADPGAAAAGIGSIAIDAVQLGMAGALVRKGADSVRIAAGGATGLTSTKVTTAGLRFTLDDAGRAVAARPGLSFLAPSEMLQGTSAAWLARRAAAARGGAVTADDMYRAANQLAGGERRMAAALVNGFGEGGEEGLQAVLEPISHGSTARWQDVAHAAMSGFAMGTGMTIGARIGAASNADRQFAQAQVNHYLRTGEELTRDAWKGLDENARRNAAAPVDGAAQVAKAAAEKLQRAQRADQVAAIPMIDKVDDAVVAQLEREAGTLNPRLDGAYRITAASSADQPNHAVVASLTQVADLINAKVEGLDVQLENAARVPLEDEAAQAARLAGLQAVRAEADAVAMAAQNTVDAYARARAAGDDAAADRIVDAFNEWVADAFEMNQDLPAEQAIARAKAASILFVRDPQDQSGSYQLLMPQVSRELTRVDANNGLQVSLAILQAIGGDFDGDKIRSQQVLELDDAGFRNIRAGMNLLGSLGKTFSDVNIATRKHEEHEILELHRALQLPSSDALHTAAAGVLTDMQRDLIVRYDGVLDADAVEDVFHVFADAVMDGSTKARGALLSAFAERYGSTLAVLGRERLSNEWYALDQIVQRRLQEFQTILASTVTRPGGPDVQPVRDIPQSPSVREFRQASAATPGIMLAQKASGSSIFRMYQKLHYSKYLAPVIQDGHRTENVQLQDMIEFYEQLNTGATRSALAELTARDEITGRVLFQLNRLAENAKLETGDALNASLAVTQLAFTQMPDVVSEADGSEKVLSTDRTLLQVLLRRSIEMERDRHAANPTPEQTARWAALSSLTKAGNGDRAFVEVFGQVQLYTLLGAAADAMGRNRTVEQQVRILNAQSETQRRASKQLLHSAPEYMGSSRSNPPYFFEPDGTFPVTSYQAVVDAILGTSTKRLSVDETGLTTGALGDTGPNTGGSKHAEVGTSYRAHEALVDGLTAVRQAFLSYTGWRKLDGKSPAAIAQVMLENPGWARDTLGLIPDTAVNAVFAQRGGQLFVANWVYEMLAMDNVQEAAMHYWRNLMLARWNALGAGHLTDATNDPRSYDQLTDRFHRLLVRLKSRNDGGVALSSFMQDMERAKDVREFMRLVNTKYRADEAPYAAWVSDVADFDADKAGGGLAKVLESSQLRTAIGAFRDRSIQLAQTIAAEQTIDQADAALINQLADDLAAEEQGKGTSVALQQLRRQLAFARALGPTLGPQAMLQESTLVQMGFYDKAHDKGKSPTHLTPMGEITALGGGPGRMTGHELWTAALTSHDASAIGSDMHAAAIDSLRGNDESGRPFDWTKLTERQMILTAQRNPGARPALRAMLFPTVYERTESGSLTPQFLTGKSISALLKGDEYVEFVTSTSPRAKKIYASMIDSIATRRGSAFAMIRATNDLVLAQTSGMYKGLTIDAAARNAEQAQSDLVDVLRMVGELAALNGPGTLADQLELVRTEVKARVARQRLARLFKLSAEDATSGVGQLVVDELVARYETQMLEEIQVLLASGSAEGAQRAVELEAEFAQKKEQLALLNFDDDFAQLLARYRIPADAARAAEVKADLARYATSTMTLQIRANWAEEALRDLYLQVQQYPDREPNLTAAQWDTISRAVIASHVTDLTGRSAARLATTEFPDPDKHVEARYWDPTFMYLVEDLLTPGSALVEAARDMHVAARLQEPTVTLDRLVDRIVENILSPDKLGAWTPDLPQQAVSANQRLDSSGVEPAISTSGQSPKNQAALAAATRRSYLLPPENTVSTLAISGTDLRGDEATASVRTTIATGDGQMADIDLPLIALNGRFARNIEVTYQGQEITQTQVGPNGAPWTETNLLRFTGPEVGMLFTADEGVLTSGYQSVTVARLLRGIEHAIPLQPGAEIDWSQVSVSMEYVHPYSQPLDPAYAHNVFFDGTSFEVSADVATSLTGTQWFAPGGLNPEKQAAALQANKKGTLALDLATVPSSATKARLEAGWEMDLARVIDGKARHLTTGNTGGGRLASHYFNAQRQSMELRHWVRGFNAEGAPELWSARQVIAFQLANPGAPLPIERAELYVPSDKTLRTMLGEIGPVGLAGPRTFDVDTSQIPTFDGNTEAIVSRVPAILETETLEDGTVVFTRGDLLKTTAVGRAAQSTLRVRPPLSDKLRAEYMRGIETRQALRENIHAARQDYARGDASTQRDNTRRALEFASGALRAIVPHLDLPGMGIKVNVPDRTGDIEATQRILNQLSQELLLNEWSAGWIFRHGGTQGPAAGELTAATLEKGGGKVSRLAVAEGDLVALDLASFQASGRSAIDALTDAQRAVDLLAPQHVTIVLPDGSTGGDLRSDVGKYLRTIGYEKVAGSEHVYRPREEFGRMSQNMRGRVTSLAEMQGITADSVVMNLLLSDLDVEENAALLNPKAQRREVAVSVDLLRNSYLGRYNLPVGEHQVEQVKQAVRMLLENELEHLLALQGLEPGAPAAREFEVSLRKLVDGWAADPDNPGVLPRSGTFGPGDVIPLYADGSPAGSLVLLRHGYEAPSATEVAEQQAVNGLNVAVSSPKRAPSHTTHVGRIRRFVTRGANGLGVELGMELQDYLDKTVLESAGMKLLLTPMQDSKVRLPEHDVFEGWPIDLVSSVHDARSKESVVGQVLDFRTAFAYLGIDFMPDLVKFFTGKDVATATAAEREQAEAAVRQLLLMVSTRLPRMEVTQVDDMLHASSRPEALMALQTMLRQDDALAERFRAGWTDELTSKERAPEAEIAFAIITYLQMTGARPGDVLAAGGFSGRGARTSGLQSILMPPVFTDFFSRSPLDSTLRTHLMQKLNARFNNPSTEEGYYLLPDFSFVVKNKDPRFSRTGRLQFAEMHSTGDNPLLDGFAEERSQKQQVSYHSGAIANMSVRGITAAAKSLVKTGRFARGEGVERFEDPGALWRLLNATSPVPAAALSQTEAEVAYKVAAYDEVGAYRKEFDTTTWEETEAGAVTAFERQRARVARAYGLTASQEHLVHGWVRQLFGRPLGTDGHGRMSYAEVMEALRSIELNAQDGYLPTFGGEVQRLHYADLVALYRANQGTSPAFRLREGENADGYVKSWDEWLQVALGYGQGDKEFDGIYLLALDGFTHTYQDAGGVYAQLPVSADALQAAELMTPEGAPALSLDPDRLRTLSTVPLYENQPVVLGDFAAGQRFEGKVRGRSAPSSEVAKRRAARNRWRRENDLAAPKPVTARNFREQGRLYVEESSHSSALLRNLINLRVANALLNPALYVSAFAETGVRGALQDITNLLVGDSVGKGGRLQAWAAAKTPEAFRELSEQLGFTPAFTPQQVSMLRTASQVLATDASWRGDIYRELAFQAPKRYNAGRIETLTSSMARLGAMSQDPTYGMAADTLSRRYIEAVMASIAANPTANTATPEYIAAQLKLDGLWVQKHMPTAHRHALATIASVRSLKATPLQLMLRGIYEPLSANPNQFVAVPSTLFLKLPLMFSGYAANVATNILGLQGWSNMLAMTLDGRRNPMSRMSARLAGKDYNPSADNTFDMSSVIEGVDLTKSFVQSGVSLTALFGFGLMAGGLGLSGEDEEDRRRRRAAQLQGAGYVYDPRKLENDFRNSDAIFLDQLPFGLSALLAPLTGLIPDSDGDLRQMVKPHWMVKQFLSPIMGFARFFETGDARQITWGFREALASFPLINQALWDDANQVYAELTAAASAHEQEGTAEALVKAQNLWTTAVMVYERMLFENAFVNQLYVGMDDYDRDPFVIPEVDSDGDIQRDRMGIPRPTKAMESFVDPETGEVRSGYVSFDSERATMNAYAENRLGVALMMSLFDGSEGLTSSLRTNMVAKTRTVEKPALSQDEAMGLVMSIWDPENQYETLTADGARGVLTGLAKGSVQLGDEALDGVFIPFEMREQIQAQWMQDITQEGLDLGLTESKAKSRMKEIWYGSLTNPDSVGISDILWSKEIPYNRDIRYVQLNTTYVTGPDGMPWATGVTRGKWLSALGLAPAQDYYAGDKGNLDVDSRLNSTDPAAGTNLGLRALTRSDESWLVPTDEEIGKAIEKAIADIEAAPAGTFQPFNSGSGWRNFGGGGYRRRGGGYGGGGGGGYGARMNPPQDNQVPYGNTIPFINTSTPIIRRATIRRERFDSDRGRLNQWQ